MGSQKIDSIVLGRGSLADNAYNPVFFTSNSIVDHWSISTTYAQYNCVEHTGNVYRSKINGNLANAPASSPASWELLYKTAKNGDLAIIIGAGATLMQRQGGFWLVFGNNPAAIIFYDEPLDIISGPPSTDNEMTGPVTTGTNITIPLDSRDGNSTEQYIVGSGDLEVRLNGVKMKDGDDYLEIGTIGLGSSIIQWNQPGSLVIGDRLIFRRVTTENLTGYGGGGGGGTVSLQDAYNDGNSIAISLGVPFTVTGTGNVAQFNGDITVTGVII